MLGTLTTQLATARPDLLAPVVATALEDWPPGAGIDTDAVLVAEIDPGLADTAAFCAAYQVPPEISANCVVVTGKREGQQRYAACLVFATARADVNGVARRLLDVRKASFAATADAVELTGMEYGGITPIGLPAGWSIFVDAPVAAATEVIIGSGVRRSKLALPGSVLAALPNAHIVDGLGIVTGLPTP